MRGCTNTPDCGTMGCDGLIKERRKQVGWCCVVDIIPGRISQKWSAYAAAMFTVLLWGSAFPATRYTLRVYSPESLMLFRFLLASATLIIIGALKGVNLPKRKDLPLIALGGFVGVFLYMLLFKNGAVHLEAGIGSFIISLAPVFTLVLSTLLLKEKVSWLCWVGIAVSFTGLVVIMLSRTMGFALDLGVILLLLAALTFSVYSIIMRKITRSYTALEATIYTIVIATVFMLIYSPALIREMPGSGLSANLLSVYLGVFPAALAYLSWGWAISKAEKTAYVSMFLYLSPIVASVLAYFWLGETLTILSLLGGVVVIAGMVMTNIASRNGSTGNSAQTHKADSAATKR